MRAACEAQLSEALRDALGTVRARVLVDELPLLSLLQAEPLQLQSSHLSFQEYFAARALCEEGTVLSGAPPWQWPAWWSNALAIGAEMGEPFRRGLLRAAGVEGESLDLGKKLGGDRPTAVRAVAELACCLREVCARPAPRLVLLALGRWLLSRRAHSSTLCACSQLNLASNGLGAEEAKRLAEGLKVKASLTSVRWPSAHEPMPASAPPSYAA